MEKRNQNEMYWDARADFEIMSDLATGARNAARKFGEVRGKMFEQDLEPEIPEWAIRQLRSRLEEPMTSPCHMAAWDTIQGLLNHLADEVDKVKVEKSKELKGATKKAMTQSGRYVQAEGGEA